MKAIFRDISIRRKLTVILMATSIIVLFLSSAAFIINEAITFWKAEKGKLSALADIIGNNSAAAIAFNDQKAAKDTLAGLSANPYILAVYIVSKDGAVFAQYIQKDVYHRDLASGLKPPADLIRGAQGSFWDWGFDLAVARPILLDGQAIGTVVIQSTLGELTSRLKSLVLAVGLIMVGTLAVAYFLSAKLQNIISGPLLRLTQTMRSVSERKDYSLREKKGSNDELGILVDGFNEMLTQIEERDEENIARAEIGRILSSTLDIDQVYDRFAGVVRRLIDFDRISICTLDSNHQTYTIAWVMGADRLGRRPGDVFPLSPLEKEYFLKNRISVLIQAEEVREVEERAPFLLPSFRFGFRSMISTPLISKDQAIGTLNLRSFKANAYTDRDREIVESIGVQISGAIANSVLLKERKRAEEALRQSEERYRTILEDIEEGYFETDLAGNFTFVNDVVYRRLGCTREEFIGMSYRQFTDEETAKKIFQAFDKVYKTGEPSRGGEWEIIKKDGTKGTYEFSASLIKDTEGRPVGFRGTSRDVTERNRMEEALRQSEEKYRTILENIEDGYYEVDLAGNFTFFNDSLCRILGYPREELMGMNDRQYTDQENARKLFQTFNQVYKTGHPLRGSDWEIIRKDGSKKYVEASVSLRKRSSGKPIGFRGIVRDITERKQAEEVLKEKTDELARSNRELEQFAYVASHDLQEPLRMVTNYVQLLAKRYKSRLDSDADDFIKFAVDGAMRMWNLINDLLTYSRVGTRAKEMEATDCETVLKETLDDLQVAVDEKGATVTHAPLPVVLGDKLQLGQLFQNLIGNAIKFSGSEPPRVHVSAIRNGSGWTFSVRDNGIGIAPEYAERIFIIFQRLHGRDEYPGTGIGLAVCKKIVERHGGRIWVESEVGKGATFHFTIPRGGGF